METKQIAVFKRAQTTAARLSAVFAPDTLPIAQDEAIRKGPHRLSIVKPTEAHIYKLEAAERLPVANLRLTLSYYLLNPTRNLVFLKWTKRRFRVFTWMNRMGLLIGVVALVLPRECAPFLVPPACLLAIPASCCSYAMLSTDLLQILVKEYEFWFFTIVNAITWTALASLCRDVRVLYLVVVSIDTELMVLMDANFRTFAPAVRTCAAAIPVLVVLATLVLSRQVDFPHYNAKPLRLGKLTVEPTEIFMNAVFTLLLLLTHKVYNKRKLLRKQHGSSRVVRCLVLRCALLMRPISVHGGSGIADEKPRREYATRVVLKKLGITAHKVYPGIKSGRTLNCRQQLVLVSLRLSTFDVSKTLYSRWWGVQQGIRTPHLVVFYFVGTVGLLLSGVSILIPGREGDEAQVDLSRTWITIIPIAGFACTSAFCGVFACVYQRDFVRAMFRNFGFLFPSLQFSLACAALADSARWDNRCWAIASYCLWFNWVLLLDAVTPPTRKQLRFRQQLAVPVVIAVWIGMLSVMYAIVIDSPMLKDRNLIYLRTGFKDITVSTKSILLNRILTTLLWTLKVMWQIFYSSEAELVLLHGTMDYYCPFDTFSGRARGLSLKAIAPACRESESSAVLEPSTEFSIGRRKSSLHPGLRRGSFKRPGPVHPQQRPGISTLPPIPPEVLREIGNRSHAKSIVTPILTRDSSSRTRNISGVMAQCQR